MFKPNNQTIIIISFSCSPPFHSWKMHQFSIFFSFHRLFDHFIWFHSDSNFFLFKLHTLTTLTIKCVVVDFILMVFIFILRVRVHANQIFHHKIPKNKKKNKEKKNETKQNNFVWIDWAKNREKKPLLIITNKTNFVHALRTQLKPNWNWTELSRAKFCCMHKHQYRLIATVWMPHALQNDVCFKFLYVSIYRYSNNNNNIISSSSSSSSCNSFY